MRLDGGSKTFCIDHNCSQLNCNSGCFSNSPFCARHVCAKCLADQSQPTNSAQPFACKQHTCTMAHCDQMQVLNSASPFCFDHACIECLANEHKPVNQRVTLSTHLCEYHKCDIKGCQQKRLNSSTAQCVYHICRVCAAGKSLLKLVNEME